MDDAADQGSPLKNLAAALGLLLAAAPVARADGPPLVQIEAPAELAGEAARVAGVPAERLQGIGRLVGLDRFGEPIRVILAAEQSEAAAGKPSWIAGYAYGALGVVVLLPERQPSYPDSSLEELLRHEVAHVLLHRAAGGRPVPRWFNEGVATVAGSSVWDLEDRSRLTLALLFARRSSLDHLDERFAGGRGEVHRAYALSGALLREMLRRFGRDAAGDVLRRVAVGLPFEEAFRRTTGITVTSFEDAFWERYSLWYRWLPLVTSSATLWIGIVLLTLWAGKKRRRRRAELEARWELEERLLESPDPPPEADGDRWIN